MKNTILIILGFSFILASFSCQNTNEKDKPSFSNQEAVKPEAIQNLPTKRLGTIFNSYDDSLVTKIQILKGEVLDLKNISIVIEGQVDTFSLDKRLMTYLSYISSNGGNGDKSKILILADRDIPFGLIRYFEFFLRLNNINRIAYGNIHKENYVTMFPPIPRKVFSSGLDKRKKVWRMKNFDEQAIALLKSYGVDTIYNCKIEYEKFVLRPENVLEVKIDSGLVDSQLTKGLFDLFEDKQFNKKIVYLETNDSIDYELVFNAHSQILSFYNELWDKASKEEFRMSFTDLENKDKKTIRNKIPLVFIRNHYSSFELFKN